MDKIQKFLVTAGRKDLAQEYYKKISNYDNLSQELKKIIDTEDPKTNKTNKPYLDFYIDDALGKDFLKNISFIDISGFEIQIYYIKNPNDRKALLLVGEIEEQTESDNSKWLIRYNGPYCSGIITFKEVVLELLLSAKGSYRKGIKLQIEDSLKLELIGLKLLNKNFSYNEFFDKVNNYKFIGDVHDQKPAISKKRREDKYVNLSWEELKKKNFK